MRLIVVVAILRRRPSKFYASERNLGAAVSHADRIKLGSASGGEATKRFYSLPCRQRRNLKILCCCENETSAKKLMWRREMPRMRRSDASTTNNNLYYCLPLVRGPYFLHRRNGRRKA